MCARGVTFASLTPSLLSIPLSNATRVPASYVMSPTKTCWSQQKLSLLWLQQALTASRQHATPSTCVACLKTRMEARL